MLLFNTKNNSKEFTELQEYKNNINKLLELDKYISKKDYINLYDAHKTLYDKLQLMEKESILAPWSKKNKTSYKELKLLMDYYENTEQIITKKNQEFIAKHLISEKEYLDNILKKDDPTINLDEEQRTAVLADEDYTLIIAGAGAGKTTTIEAKVKYLIDKQDVDPNKILIVSFTKKATKELQDRCKKLNLPVAISTFHSIANTIINKEQETKYQIATVDFMFTSIKKFLLNNTNDEIFVKKVLLFFASYLEVPISEDNINLLFNKLNKDDCTTLRSDIAESLQELSKKQTRSKYTIQNEKVRSIEECKIANYLFINGIDYQYEPVYKYGFNDTIKPYCPDFIIRQYNKEIYIEHFGISEDGTNNRFTEEELIQYKKHINDKIRLHKQHGTKLIYTFSKYKDGRNIVSHLKEELIKAGISLEPKNSKEIYNAILKNAEDKYFNKFIQLICIFISRFKTNNFPSSKFEEWKISLTDERTKLFVTICQQCYLAYMTALKNTNSIDFEDMINNATNVLDKMINKGDKLPYDYILIDEYQDISLQRFDLCEKLSKCSDAKIIAVGDDWQSIFKFSGAKIELFTKFEEIMGYANILKITNTYRNSQQLIDIAGNFVMSNDEQIKKKLKSNKSLENPIVLMSFDDSYEKNEYNEGPRKRMMNTIEKSLDLIVKEKGEKQKVLLIGRYGFEGYLLDQYTNNFIYHNGTLKSKKYPYLQITYLTAHSSKGLGYDNVIIMNAKDAVLGFPSKIVDDSVMKLVIKDNEQYEFAEERRLFYVALTRTKNKVYIITPKYKPSKFVLELKEQSKNVIITGEELEPKKEISNVLKCPCCGYPLQRRANHNFKIKSRIWLCSNDPEVCGFATNDLSAGKLSISKCPKCTDGYLIVKTIKHKNGTESKMLGCTNYKADGTGCSAYMMSYNYTQDKEEVNLRFYDEKTNLDEVTLCNHPYKELVNVLTEVIKTYQNMKVSLGPRMLFSLLSGEMTKAIQTFGMYKNKRFGYLQPTDKRKFYVLLRAMKEEKIIQIDDENYGKITMLKELLNDNDYKIIYASMKLE